MSRLPIERDALVVPRGDEVVMIFWADDEAKVWLNDYFVGETRLTPVEVVVPSLYLSSTNRIRVRCWDTDWVESGVSARPLPARRGWDVAPDCDE